MTKSWTDRDFIEAVETNNTIGSVLSSLGLKPSGSNYRNFHRSVKELGLDTGHFLGKRHAKGKRSRNSKPIEHFLRRGFSSIGSYRLKLKLFELGMKNRECEICGLKQWRGRPAPLHLDHINGVNDDNRLENLRILCPNCHAQTDTYAGNNRGRRK